MFVNVVQYGSNSVYNGVSKYGCPCQEIITLCVYAQHGCVFGRVVYVYTCTKNV